MVVQIEIGVGELVDKITILDIKSRKIKDPQKNKNIVYELETLKKVFSKIFDKHHPHYDKVADLRFQLFSVNQKLWIIEDRIRELEDIRKFDEEFISIARMVYQNNDERAAIKRELNMIFESKIIEEKSYSSY